MHDQSHARRWNLIEVEVAPGVEEDASSLLFDLGTAGIVTLAENPFSVKLGAYFEPGQSKDDLISLLRSRIAESGLAGSVLGLEASEIPDQDWMQKWKEGFEPTEVSRRLIIAPSWKVPSDATSRIVVRIDPGMAFGTGTHETTRLCLQAVEDHWAGGSLLDVGTGTGIIAIAAALLQPGSRVRAIDIDPVAVTVARENAEINRVADAIEIFEGQPRNLAGANFDVVVANLTAEVLIELMYDLMKCAAPRGTLILSGILATVVFDVERAVREAGMHVIERQCAGEWCALVVRKG
jgi:ribosomal protein L11 methyltransferase